MAALTIEEPLHLLERLLHLVLDGSLRALRYEPIKHGGVEIGLRQQSKLLLAPSEEPADQALNLHGRVLVMVTFRVVVSAAFLLLVSLVLFPRLPLEQKQLARVRHPVDETLPKTLRVACRKACVVHLEAQQREVGAILCRRYDGRGRLRLDFCQHLLDLHPEQLHQCALVMQLILVCMFGEHDLSEQERAHRCQWNGVHLPVVIFDREQRNMLWLSLPFHQ
mmetsp:Transcript_4164/g.8099  ORF Transcript_4164/g.8099 Transcript_4164/m.8099 type:complete len:222 (+) Transcript_4164:349-1014(+)